MKTTNHPSFRKWYLPVFLMMQLGAVSLHATTFTWDGGLGEAVAPTKQWSNPTNWTGNVLPDFNNTTDIILYGVGSPNLDAGMGTNPPIVIRSLTYTADADATVTIRPRNAVGGTQPSNTLTFQANVGNAWITIDSGASASHEILGKLASGAGGGGAIQLLSSLDIVHNGTNTTTGPTTLSMGQNAAGAAYETIIYGPGAINKSGTGYLLLGGSSTFSGGLYITGGRVMLDTNLAAGTGPITLAGTGVELQPSKLVNIANALIVSDLGDDKTLRFFGTGSTATYAGNVDIQETTTTNGFSIQSGAGATIVLSGNISGSGGAGLKKGGSGMVILSGTNTYAGPTVCPGGGLLILTNSGTLPDSTALNLSATNAAFDLSGITASSETIGSLAGSAGSVVILGSKSLSAGAGDTNSTSFLGNISGTSGSLTKTGNGVLTLGGTNTFTGGINIAGGRVALTVNAATSTGGITMNGTGAELQLGDGMNVTNSLTISDIGDIKTLRLFANAATYSGNVDIQETTGGNFTVQAGTGSTLTLSGTVGGAGGAGLKKINPGTVILAGSTTYAGRTIINSGKLALTGSATLGSSTNITMESDTVLDVTGLSASTLNLGVSQTLAANGTNGVICGNINATVGALEFSCNTTNPTPALTITNGTLTLNNNAVTVLASGGALPAGSYKLIATNNAGQVTGTVAASGVNVLGSGLASGATASLSLTNGELYLVVISATLYPPVFGNSTLAGSGIVLNFSGTNGQSWQILSSTNLTTSLASWSVIATGIFSGAPVSYTNASMVDPSRFYIITSP